jgi:hypothetical protein
MGALTRLDPSSLIPFTQSLRQTGFNGRFLVVVGGYDAGARAQLEAIADAVVVVDGDLPAHPPRLTGFARVARGAKRHWTLYEWAFGAVVLLGPPRTRRQRWTGLEFHLEGLQALRYGLYLHALETIAADANQIFLTDLRDVLFQDDPFALPVAGLEVFLEDASQTIGTSPFNRRWIRDVYGRDEQERVARNTVSCSGTVIGDRDSIRSYLEAMRSEVERAIRRWQRPLASHDQGIHNWLLYTDRLRGAHVVPNEHGRVLTMGAMSGFRRGADGKVLNADGSVPSVLHQYDRHAAEFADLVRSLTSPGPSA